MDDSISSDSSTLSKRFSSEKDNAENLLKSIFQSFQQLSTFSNLIHQLSSEISEQSHAKGFQNSWKSPVKKLWEQIGLNVARLRECETDSKHICELLLQAKKQSDKLREKVQAIRSDHRKDTLDAAVKAEIFLREFTQTSNHQHTIDLESSGDEVDGMSQGGSDKLRKLDKSRIEHSDDDANDGSIDEEMHCSSGTFQPTLCCNPSPSANLPDDKIWKTNARAELFQFIARTASSRHSSSMATGSPTLANGSDGRSVKKHVDKDDDGIDEENTEKNSVIASSPSKDMEEKRSLVVGVDFKVNSLVRMHPTTRGEILGNGNGHDIAPSLDSAFDSTCPAGRLNQAMIGAKDGGIQSHCSSVSYGAYNDDVADNRDGTRRETVSDSVLHFPNEGNRMRSDCGGVDSWDDCSGRDPGSCTNSSDLVDEIHDDDDGHQRKLMQSQSQVSDNFKCDGERDTEDAVSGLNLRGLGGVISQGKKGRDASQASFSSENIRSDMRSSSSMATENRGDAWRSSREQGSLEGVVRDGLGRTSSRIADKAQDKGARLCMLDRELKQLGHVGGGDGDAENGGENGIEYFELGTESASDAWDSEISGGAKMSDTPVDSQMEPIVVNLIIGLPVEVASGDAAVCSIADRSTPYQAPSSSSASRMDQTRRTSLTGAAVAGDEADTDACWVPSSRANASTKTRGMSYKGDDSSSAGSSNSFGSIGHEEWPPDVPISVDDNDDEEEDEPGGGNYDDDDEYLPGSDSGDDSRRGRKPASAKKQKTPTRCGVKRPGVSSSESVGSQINKRMTRSGTKLYKEDDAHDAMVQQNSPSPLPSPIQQLARMAAVNTGVLIDLT